MKLNHDDICVMERTCVICALFVFLCCVTKKVLNFEKSSGKGARNLWTQTLLWFFVYISASIFVSIQWHSINVHFLYHLITFQHCHWLHFNHVPAVSGSWRCWAHSIRSSSFPDEEATISKFESYSEWLQFEESNPLF